MANVIDEAAKARLQALSESENSFAVSAAAVKAKAVSDDGSFAYNGGMCYPADEANKKPTPTWANTSGSSQWITLAHGLRQFVSDGDVVEITQAAYENFMENAGGAEPGSQLDAQAAMPKREMDIWWAIKVNAFLENEITSSIIPRSLIVLPHSYEFESSTVL